MSQQASLDNSENSPQHLEAEYTQFIRESVETKAYFKDALDWYFSRYVTPICDRTLLIFGAMLAAVVMFCLVEMINGAFPLVQEAPIFIRAKDQSIYTPNLIALKARSGEKNYDPDIKTVDEAIAKYLLGKYVQEREGYNYSKGVVEDVNTKFNHIKNTSSATEYRAFQALMSKDNPESPIQTFGQKIIKNIKIESVKFIRKNPQDFKSKAIDYISNKTPTAADVRFTAITQTQIDDVLKEDKQQYLARINFSLSPIEKKQTKENLGFSVASYKLYKVK